MGNERQGLYKVLRLSLVYNAIQHALGGAEATRFVVESHIRPFPGARVLDIGAGTGAIAQHLIDVEYLGIEPNPRYVEDFNARQQSAKARLVTGTTETVAVPSESFDIVIVSAVLHHVTDDQSKRIIEYAMKALSPNGRVVLLDPVLHDGQHWIARFLAKRDRGKYIRDLDRYRALFPAELSDVKITLKTDLLRVPYSHVLTELSTSR